MSKLIGPYDSATKPLNTSSRTPDLTNPSPSMIVEGEKAEKTNKVRTKWVCGALIGAVIVIVVLSIILIVNATTDDKKVVVKTARPPNRNKNDADVKPIGPQPYFNERIDQHLQSENLGYEVMQGVNYHIGR